VVLAHGQMGEKKLESSLVEVHPRRSGRVVATTIVENGLDIRAPTRF